MKSKLILGGLVILLTVGMAYAGEAKIELITVYEKTFDEPIVDVIFDTATITVEEAKALGWKGLEGRELGETTLITYPKILVKEGKIEFLDEKGSVKKIFSLLPLKGEINRITVNFSKNRKFIGVVKSRKEFTMLNTDGDILWQTDISRVGYGWPYISPDGKYIVCVGDITGDCGDYFPSIWDKNGFVKGLVEEDQRDKYELLHLDFTEGGDYFVATFRQKGYELKGEYEESLKTLTYAPKPLNYLTLCLFNRNGKKIWQKMIERGRGGYVTISENGSYIAVVIWQIDSESQELHLYKRNGDFCWKTNIRLGETYFSFSKNELSLAVACECGSFYYFDVQSGETRWFYKEKDTQATTYRSVFSNIDNSLFTVFGFYCIGSRRIHDLLCLFDFNGKLIAQKKFAPAGLFTKYPSLHIPLPGHYPSTLFTCSLISFLNGNDSKIISLKVNIKGEK